MSESEEHEDLAPAEAKPPRSDEDFERHDPLEAQPPPRSPTPAVIPRGVQRVALPLIVLGLYVVLRASGPVVLLFITAAVIALILTPVVGLLQRAHLPRGLAIAAVYLGFIGVLALAGFLAYMLVLGGRARRAGETGDLVEFDAGASRIVAG